MNAGSSLLEMVFQGGPKEGVGASDMITGEGTVEDLPRFLIEALRQIIYRFHQTGMWSDDNDIRLYVPRRYSVEFAYIWTKYLFDLHSEIEPRQIAEENFITIDNIRIRIQEGLSERYYLAVVRVGTDELIKWDPELGRWLHRASWAIAGYRVTA